MRLPIFDQRLTLRGVDPQFAEASALANDPAGTVVTSAPSMESILFPRQPSAGILTPEDRAMLKRNAILQVAASLLQAGGRSPRQQGTLANIGNALAGLDLPGAMQSALRMRAVTDELNQRASARQALQDIVARHPAMPGENRDQKFNRLTDIVIEAAGVPGLEDWIGKTSNVLAQLRPPKEGRLLSAVEKDDDPNSPTFGRLVRTYRDPETGDLVRKGGEAPPQGQYFIDSEGNVTFGTPTGGIPVPGAKGKPLVVRDSVLEHKARLGARNAAEAADAAIRLVESDPDANILPVVADIAGSAAESKAADYIPGLRGAAGALHRSAMSPNQNKFQNLLNVVAHNSVGLLPGSRQSLVLFQNLRDSYATASGDPEELRAQKLALLKNLRDGLRAIANGQEPDLSAIPGYEDYQGIDAVTSKPTTGEAAPTPTAKPLTGWRALNPERQQ